MIDAIIAHWIINAFTIAVIGLLLIINKSKRNENN